MANSPRDIGRIGRDPYQHVAGARFSQEVVKITGKAADRCSREVSVCAAKVAVVVRAMPLSQISQSIQAYVEAKGDASVEGGKAAFVTTEIPVSQEGTSEVTKILSEWRSAAIEKYTQAHKDFIESHPDICDISDLEEDGRITPNLEVIARNYPDMRGAVFPSYDYYEGVGDEGYVFSARGNENPDMQVARFQ